MTRDELAELEYKFRGEWYPHTSQHTIKMLLAEVLRLQAKLDSVPVADIELLYLDEADDPSACWHAVGQWFDTLEAIHE